MCMASIILYTTDGSTKGELALNDNLFAVPVDAGFVHEAVVAQNANSRVAIAHTKTRGEVAGSGKKPWKQKGTGRARHGSRRSPLWSGGGITFGPRNNRNFTLKINRKARRKALAMVLSDKVTNNRLVAIDKIGTEGGKTRQLIDLLAKLPSAGKKTVIVTTPDDRSACRAAQNLSGIGTLPANALNVVDLLRFDYVIMTEPAIQMVSEIYKRD